MPNEGDILFLFIVLFLYATGVFITYYKEIYNFFRHYRKENKGFYTSYNEKMRNRDNGKNILILFHGTTLPFKQVPYLCDDNNVFTIDINPKTKPTFVANAASLQEHDPIKLLSIKYFDIIVMDICEGDILNSIVQTGIKDFMREVVMLLKEDGRLYVSGLRLLCGREDGLKLSDLNALNLRVYLGVDMIDANKRMNTDPSYYVLTKNYMTRKITDECNLLGIRKW